MSATLNRALASGNLNIRKVASGEVIIVFRNPVLKTERDGAKKTVTIKPVRISGRGVIDMFSRTNVDSQAVAQSNLAVLIKSGVLEVV